MNVLVLMAVALISAGVLAFVIYYVQYHDAGITIEHLIADWACEDIKEYLDYDGKKTPQNHLRSSVEKVYADRCKT